MDMDKLVSLCKRRGFIYPSSEIYGGLNGFWDYGPLGVELKNNIKQAWWQDMVRNPPPGPDGEEVTVVGVDCALIMNPRVWEASGHVSGFADPMVDCKKCRKRFRADKVWLLAYFEVEPGGSAGLQAAWAAMAQDGPAPPLLASPKLVVPVEAESQEEAEKHTLSKTQAKAFQGELWRAACPLPRAPASWPRRCPACLEGELTEPRSFNLMFKTYVGAVEDASAVAYLRPETAQGIFVNFKNVLDSSRVRLPFGIAQIGKAFRNEINPRNFTFRSREFEQMEIEFFCHPRDSMRWYDYWRQVRKDWYTRLGIRSERLRPREQSREELAHYSIGTTDIEYLFPFASEPQELEGVAHRGCFDLMQHQQHSGRDLSYFDELAWERDKPARGFNAFKEWLKTNPPAEEVEKYQFLPHVIEPSAGVDRFALAALCEAYDEDEVAGEKRVVLRFHPRLAPIKAAVLPLVNKEGMPERATALYRELKREFAVAYDDGGAIGRRYRRQDEIGTPFCVTIDGQTAQDGTVTLRDRDDCRQIRLPITAVAAELRKRLQV
jgi:glycyl-tRNA synthetase